MAGRPRGHPVTERQLRALLLAGAILVLVLLTLAR